MRPGQVVELRKGTLGLQPPLCAALLLRREGHGDGARWRILTTTGEGSVSPNAFSRRTIPTQLDLSLPQAELQRRLVALGAHLAGSGGSTTVLEGTALEVALWEAVVDTVAAQGPQTQEGLLALAAAGGLALQPAQLQQALQPCRASGCGRLRHAGGRPERWDVLRREQLGDISAHVMTLRQLRNRLVRTITTEVDGREVEVLQGIPIERAALEPPLQDALSFAGAAMARLLVHEHWPGPSSDLDPPTARSSSAPAGQDPDRDRARGLGGTDVIALDGFDLPSYCQGLAVDWAGASRHASASAMAEFLHRSGLRSLPQVVTLLARRLVRVVEGFSWSYPPGAVTAAEALPPLERADQSQLQGRWDLREQPAVSIDPPTAADFDDAIFLQEEPDGGATLWVHIADVAHYVPLGGVVDREAVRRGTSVYLPIGVLPMLPPRLSDDLCSLRAGSDRLTVSVQLQLRPDGTVGPVAASPSVIRVRANARYPQVDAAIAAGEEPYRTYHRWAQRLAAARDGLPLETAELQVQVAEGGTALQRKGATAATSMVEAFMVAANEAVARLLSDGPVSALYRCHPLPDRAAVALFNRQMAVLGLDHELRLPEPIGGVAVEEAPSTAGGASLLEALRGGGRITLGAPAAHDGGDGEDAPAPVVGGLAQLDPARAAAYLTAVREAITAVQAIDDLQVRQVAQLKALGMLGRALYSVANLGHFGLGSTCYCHFTSPIRRYPDLVVHRQLRWLLSHEEGTTPPHGRDELERLAPLLSDLGGAAARLEWDLQAIALALGSPLEGAPRVSAVVASITRGGVFLELRDGRSAVLPPWELGGRLHVDEDQALLLAAPLRPGTMLDAAQLRGLLDAARADLPTDVDGMPLRPLLSLGQALEVELVGRDLLSGRIFARPVQALGQLPPQGR